MAVSKARKIAEEVNAVMGPGSVGLLSDPEYAVSYLPTGCLPIDVIFQGGIPQGRFTEIYGNYSTLKSYIGYSTIAQAQEAGLTCALIDAEGAASPKWMKRIGVDRKELIMVPVETGERAIDRTQFLITQGVDLVVWDSIAATLPKAEANVMMGGDSNTQPARQAAMMSEALRKLQATINANRNTAVLCINQTRSKVGIVFGSPESVPGGNALPFYASYRLAIRKMGKVTVGYKVWDGDKMVDAQDTVAMKFRGELLKSKLSAPDRQIHFQWDLENGRIDETGFVISYGLELGLISFEQKGKGARTWQVKGIDRKFRGADALRGYLDSTPKVRSRLKTAVLASALPADNESDD